MDHLHVGVLLDSGHIQLPVVSMMIILCTTAQVAFVRQSVVLSFFVIASTDSAGAAVVARADPALHCVSYSGKLYNRSSFAPATDWENRLIFVCPSQSFAKRIWE